MFWHRGRGGNWDCLGMASLLPACLLPVCLLGSQTWAAYCTHYTCQAGVGPTPPLPVLSAAGLSSVARWSSSISTGSRLSVAHPAPLVLVQLHPRAPQSFSSSPVPLPQDSYLQNNSIGHCSVRGSQVNMAGRAAFLSPWSHAGPIWKFWQHSNRRTRSEGSTDTGEVLLAFAGVSDCDNPLENARVNENNC